MTQQLMVTIASQGLPFFMAVLLVIQLAAKELGHWVGHRRAMRGGAAGEGVGIVVGGMLGLLAFVLALTLSFSSARYQERRDGTLAEANAIGTAWLRAQAIGHPRGSEIARLLEDYTRVRIAYVQADARTPEIRAINARSSAIQGEVWGHLSAIVQERQDPVAVALMASLNETFDLATAERFAFALGFPPQLFWLLIGMTLLCMAALGYQLSLRRTPLRVLTMLLLAMWTVTITTILDLGSARAGHIRVPTTAYEWTLESFRGGVTIPPAPR